MTEAQGQDYRQSGTHRDCTIELLMDAYTAHTRACIHVCEETVPFRPKQVPVLPTGIMRLEMPVSGLERAGEADRERVLFKRSRHKCMWTPLVGLRFVQRGLMYTVIVIPRAR